MIRPGVKAVDVDALSREVLDKYDLARFFGHGLGHGLGSVVHDVGGLNTRSKDIIAEGQIWTVEPGVYIPGFGGVRIEDDVAVSADGCEILTRAPKRMNPV
jgi:Xaa-Pro aminopeptidase